jgi:hypothetical protein
MTRLSPKSAFDLGLIADEHSYSQIADGPPEVSRLDRIVQATLDLVRSPRA